MEQISVKEESCPTAEDFCQAYFYILIFILFQVVIAWILVASSSVLCFTTIWNNLFKFKK